MNPEHRWRSTLGSLDYIRFEVRKARIDVNISEASGIDRIQSVMLRTGVEAIHWDPSYWISRRS